MCTPWTIPRLVRWRVRDWASCFLACRFPLDEDYIVFCFREDGAFDVVKDGKPETSNRFDCTSRSSRPVSRKLNYGEEAKTVVERYGNEEKLNRDGHDIFPTNDGDVRISDQKDEEEDCIYFDTTESPTNGIRRRYQVEEVEDRGLVSVESSESNQSDGSTGSFAFPVCHELGETMQVGMGMDG
uniref:Uncharacterized protein n=1 Tax=Fagus sylvatica TaxID=28930 RepID=A0A2N9J7M8_FAGSY